jgi:predicted ABC-type ATPase
MPKPVLYVLAGVNGAGKSSVGGHLLTQAGLSWFNPDTYARELVRQQGLDQAAANAAAWQEGVRRLDAAVASGSSYAFETTLGGRTLVQKLVEASATHDVLVWFCGLRDAELHLARVQLRVTQGGHDIAEERIRQRWHTSRQNLIGLMPHLSQLSVFDNSASAAVGEPIPDPRLLLRMDAGHLAFPLTPEQVRQTPDWAKPLVEAAFQSSAGRRWTRPVSPRTAPPP